MTDAIEMQPIGVVVGGRAEPTDDHWTSEQAVIELDAGRFGPDAVAALGDFSHLEVVYSLHRVAPGTEEQGARRPRGRSDWPLVGIFAQRGKRRPNRIGVSRCRLLGVDGTRISVQGLDAIDGTPVLDIKPWMREFGPQGLTRQPAWSTELMADYYDEAHAMTPGAPNAPSTRGAPSAPGAPDAPGGPSAAAAVASVGAAVGRAVAPRQITGLHHVQVSCPAGSEERLRAFYAGVLGMTEVPKPPVLAARGGAWFRSAAAELHCGVEDGFRPARKAHPCLLVADVDAVAQAVSAAGGEIRWDENVPGVRRFHTDDPVGNRIELQQA